MCFVFLLVHCHFNTDAAEPTLIRMLCETMHLQWLRIARRASARMITEDTLTLEKACFLTFIAVRVFFLMLPLLPLHFSLFFFFRLCPLLQIYVVLIRTYTYALLKRQAPFFLSRMSIAKLHRVTFFSGAFIRTCEQHITILISAIR